VSRRRHREGGDRGDPVPPARSRARPRSRPWPLPRGPRRSALVLTRSVGAEELLETFLVAAVAAVLGIRLSLAATGYPQLGGGGLHIAHLLWGGLLMLVALVASLALIGRGLRRWTAVVGGLGFGAFIDESGKFVTADNDSFVQPTIVLIYLVFVGLIFAFRAVGRGRPTLSTAATAAVLDLLQVGRLRGFSPGERGRALRLLDRTDPADPLTRSRRLA